MEDDPRWVLGAWVMILLLFVGLLLSWGQASVAHGGSLVAQDDVAQLEQAVTARLDVLEARGTVPAERRKWTRPRWGKE